MDGSMWSKVHGAAVHFPIALVACSGGLDALGLLMRRPALRGGLHSAGYWSLLAGAAGTVPAVVSGLVMTRGVLLGHGALRAHHLAAWPAFALIVGLAAWRSASPELAPRGPALGYIAAVGVATALVLAAGYWGGEMLLGQ
jgi:uncharacterized membrane protein